MTIILSLMSLIGSCHELLALRLAPFNNNRKPQSQCQGIKGHQLQQCIPQLTLMLYNMTMSTIADINHSAVSLQQRRRGSLCAFGLQQLLDHLNRLYCCQLRKICHQQQLYCKYFSSLVKFTIESKCDKILNSWSW